MASNPASVKASVASGAASFQLIGLKETLAAFNKLGSDANKELRAASSQVARETALQIKSAASSAPQQGPIAGQSVRAISSRVPEIKGGGPKRVGRKGVAAGSIFFGAEFGGRGSRRTMQFPPHRGTLGYFFWPTIRARAFADTEVYLQALNRLCQRWASGG